MLPITYTSIGMRLGAKTEIDMRPFIYGATYVQKTNRFPY